MEELAAEFGLEKVDAARPLVRKVGWKTRETEAEREYWQHCDKPAARFFIEANPGYVEGHGLVTVVPVTAAILLRLFRTLGETRLRKPLEAAPVTGVSGAVGLAPAALRDRPPAPGRADLLPVR